MTKVKKLTNPGKHRTFPQILFFSKNYSPHLQTGNLAISLPALLLADPAAVETSEGLCRCSLTTTLPSEVRGTVREIRTGAEQEEEEEPSCEEKQLGKFFSPSFDTGKCPN